MHCWGGYFITTITVQRMYALHFLLPFMVAGCVVIHLCLLHVMGSGTASTVPGTTIDGEAIIMYYYKGMSILQVHNEVETPQDWHRRCVSHLWMVLRGVSLCHRVSMTKDVTNYVGVTYVRHVVTRCRGLLLLCSTVAALQSCSCTW